MSAATEVVTRALVRDALVPVDGHDPVRIAVVTLDNGAGPRRPTTFGPVGLAELEAAFAALAARDDLDAVAVTGKPFVFAVGADLTLLDGLSDRDSVVDLGRLGHRAFGRLGELGVPTFAFVNGPAMGGGTELALHCDHRTVSRAAGTISLPEVSLGIVPGWGGTWLLPHLVGPDVAVTVAVENPLNRNRQLDAATAVELGVADVLLDSADFLTQSLRWAADVVRGRVSVARPEARHDAGAWAQAIARGRLTADARTHGAADAPYVALDLIEAARARSRAEGFAAEDEALADLLLAPQARAALYAFDLVQRRAKRPAGAPDAEKARAVTKVGIAGAGLMARQIALLTASRTGAPVVLLDRSQDLLDAGLDAIGGEITMLTEQGVFSPDKANRLRALVTGDIDWSAFADCDLVIEAVYEELDVKRDVLHAIEDVVRPDCVVATNTSALSMSAITRGARHPERILGLHFFNPVAMMPLVEIVRTSETDDPSIATAFAFVAALGKSAVACADTPGFVVNRILSAYVDACVAAIDEGTPAQSVENAALGLGFPLGPLQLVELVGPAVADHVGDSMAAAFPTRYHAASPTLRALAAREPGPIAVRDGAEVRVAPDVVALLDRPGEALAEGVVQERVMTAIADEITAMRSDGTVSDVRDIDLCLLLGAGWPAYLGGITPELRRRSLFT